MASNIEYHQELVNLIESDPLFKKNYDVSHHQYRDITFQRLQKIIQSKFIDVTKLLDDPEHFFQIMNTLHAYDHSLAIKTGVNFGLFGGGLLRLGNTEQIKQYLSNLNEGKIFGALAITEIGHGSNLKELATIAYWDDMHKTYTLHTPNHMATKCWIGNASKHATHAIVFAQLEYHEANMGLHPFLVQLRGSDGALCQGITITDNGCKKGLNGVDNGCISFNSVVLPHSALLIKYGYISEFGEYVSSYEAGKDDNKRFANLLSTLSGGRGVLASGSIITALKANIISIKYGMGRRQFSGQSNVETLALTNTISYMKEIGLADYKETGTITKRVHALSSGLKVICSEHAEKCCRIGRLCCGGHGYALENELALMHNDIDIYQTFEGDNTLLRQEVCKYELLMMKDHVGDTKLGQYLYFFRSKLVSNFNFVTKLFNGKLDTAQSILDLITYKLKHLTLELVDSLIFHIKNGVEPFEAWNKVLDKVLLVADIYMYKKSFEIFMQNNKNNKSAEGLVLLYGYSLLTGDISLEWYLINSAITSHLALLIINQKKILARALLLNIVEQDIDQHLMPKLFWQTPMLATCIHKSKL